MTTMNPNAKPFTPTLLLPSASGSSNDPAEALEEIKTRKKNSIRNPHDNEMGKKITSSVCPLNERTSPTRVRRQRRQRQPRRHRYTQDVKKHFDRIEMASENFDEGKPNNKIDLEQIDDSQRPSSLVSQGPDSQQLRSSNHGNRNSNSNQFNHETRRRRRRNRCNNMEKTSSHVNIDNKRSGTHATTNVELSGLHDGNVNENAKKCSIKNARKQRAMIKKNGTHKTNLTTADILEPTSSFADAQFPDTIQNQIDEVDLDLESSFPMLPFVANHDKSKRNAINPRRKDVSNDAVSCWSECLVDRILTTSSLDQGKIDGTEIKWEEPSGVISNSNVPLTRLSYSSNQNYYHEGVAKSGQETFDTAHKHGQQKQEDRGWQSQETKQIFSNSETNYVNGNVVQNLLLPNIKGKWNDTQLARMRQRWWDAELAKRRIEEEKRRKDNIVSNYEEDASNDSFDGNSSSSSSSSCCTSSSFDVNPKIEDEMQPPSLSKPFDESISTSPYSNLGFHQSEPSSISQQSPVYQRILHLERECLQSSRPLHFIIAYCYGLQQQRRKISDNASSETVFDAETVLFRLLTKQVSEEIAQWKATKLDLKDLIGMEDYSTVISGIPLLSADPTRLTPLQLSILLDLPHVVRILLCNPSYSSISEGKVSCPGIEEDEFGRTPLMLACELHRLECIETLLSLTKVKLDHREYEWGNSAFHFCCLRKMSDYGTRWDDEVLSENTAADAIDILLNKAPYPNQRRILMSINNEGQNLLHLACASGNLRLVDCILEHLNSRGHNLVMKALNMKDRNRCVPFLSAVAADARDIAMHLLVSRFANRSDLSTWFAGCPLAIASSNDSIEMVRMLLEVGHPTVYDTNLALLKAVRCTADESHDECDGDSEAICEIMSLLISSGANPHSLVATSEFPEQHLISTDRLALNKHLNVRHGVTPLTVAVCSYDVEGVKTMLTSYALALPSIRSSRRSDPLLRSQPESYFQTLEKREDDVVDSSLQSALVNSLFQWWKHRRLASARIALGLYRRGVQLAQKRMQWLADSLQASMITPPPLTHFQVPSTIFQIISEYKPKGALTHDIDTSSIEWSRVLSSLDWFPTSINEIRCRFFWQLFHTRWPREPVEELRLRLKDDEFYLIVEDEKIIAHKSIVSTKSGKLAAAIHFNEAQRERNSDHLSVEIDLPVALAKMLLTHIYHGSIAFGLKTNPTTQCHQLLELALLAEEYLCPTLILECEMRLLKHGGKECICRHCSDSYISKADQTRCLVQQKCLEDASASARDNELCEIAGVFECKTTSFIDSPRSGLIIPETVLDVLAVAQHMVQSSSAHHGFYGMKYFKYEGIDLSPTNGTSLLGANHNNESLSAPFLAVKVAGISVVLKNFKAVINSDSYLREVHCDQEERTRKTALDPVAKADIEESSIALLSLCLDALKHNPFTIKDDQMCHAGANDICGGYFCFEH
eukprot:CCRYP_011188-RA/>CCRYP_011188-RA protein AED:0.01 eAED:0.01 QI:82/1/1/1/1/1/3/535/1451